MGGLATDGFGALHGKLLLQGPAPKLSSFPRRWESSNDLAMKDTFAPSVYLLASARNGTL